MVGNYVENIDLSQVQIKRELLYSLFKSENETDYITFPRLAKITSLFLSLYLVYANVLGNNISIDSPSMINIFTWSLKNC